MQISVEGVEFYIEDQYLGTIVTPAGNPFPFLTSELPVCMQSRNSGAVTGIQQMRVGHVRVDADERRPEHPIPAPAVRAGSHGVAGPAGRGHGQHGAVHQQSRGGRRRGDDQHHGSPRHGPGGQFSALPTLAAGTDGIVCSYQNPVGSVTVQPRTLMITGVKISSVVTTALTGGPCIYAYSLAYGHTAVSMATAEGTSFGTSPSTKAPRRVALGIETIAATATVGVVGSAAGIYTPFASPVAVNPGEFVAICAKNFGTVTSAGVVTFLVTFDGYWI